MLDSLSVPVRPTNLDNRSTALAVGAVFFSFFFFFFFLTCFLSSIISIFFFPLSGGRPDID